MLDSLTNGQVAFFLSYFGVLGCYVYSLLLQHAKQSGPGKRETDVELVDSESKESGQPLLKVVATDIDSQQHVARDSSNAQEASWLNNSFCKCIALDPQALVDEHATLKAMAEFGTLMVWYFLCDRTSLLPHGDKRYSMDIFLFIFIVLTIVAFGTSLQTLSKPILLNRPQTEEWKGWMQVGGCCGAVLCSWPLHNV